MPDKTTPLTDSERSGLDAMIAEARRLKGQPGTLTLRRYVDDVPISGLGSARVWMFAWALDDVVKGLIGWRPYGAESEVSEFQARCAKYFADGVQAKSVIMHTPDGKTEKLR